MTVRASQLAALAEAIAAVWPLSSPADVALGEFFRRRRQLGQRDRAYIAEGVFAVLRRRRSLALHAATSAPRALAIAASLRELGLSLRELDAALTDEERDWARAFKARKPDLSPAEAADLPDWLWEALGEALPAEREALARAWLTPAPLDLRINPLKTTRDAALAALAADGIGASCTPYSPLGLRVAGKPYLQRHPLLMEGALEIQDEGSQLVCFLVAPRRTEMVVDFCAGAGGKTLLLGALMRSQGRVYAFDISLRRLAELKARLARSGLSNVHPVRVADERDPRIGRLAGKIDRVLVDAPCTGLGTLRRHPDLKWRQTPSAAAAFAVTQARLLAAAAPLTKPGGRLVYATCSVLPAENEAIVDGFLAEHPAFELCDAAPEFARAGIELDGARTLRLYPHRHGCDGFFAAALQRVR